MPQTRASVRKADGAGGADQAGAGSKHDTEHKRGVSPDAKKRKKDVKKKQATIEETVGGRKHDDESQKHREDDDTASSEPDGTATATDAGNSSAVRPGARESAVPSTILEKGVIYFFFRARVDMSTPHKTDDIARTYFLLRPLEKDAALGAGPVGDAGNARLLALPKKVLPRSGRERYMAFVEKAGVGFADLRDEFLAGNEYETKTRGTRHTPAAAPAGEGVYAITSTGRESHLAYILTLPEELGEVQKGIGLRERGSWIISTRNPEFAPPKGASLPKGPEYPKEIKSEFRSLRWVPTRPEHLSYPNTQVLLIGESSGLAKAMAPAGKDEGAEDAEEPIEEMEKLEDEDTRRMEGLGDDDAQAIFADLQTNAEEYPKLQTAF